MSTHGTDTCYAGGCRRPECRAAHTAGARRRRRMIAYGVHVPRSVPNVGSRRRVEALMTLGWSQRSLSRMCGWHADRINVLFTVQTGISPRNAQIIARLYDQLWDQPPPTTCKGERIAVGRTIQMARARGYAPPLAWDDDTIDDSDAQPTEAPPPEGDVDDVAVDRIMHGQLRIPDNYRPKSLEFVEAVRRLAARGLSDTEIGDRVGATNDCILKIRHRGGIPAGVPCTREPVAA